MKPPRTDAEWDAFLEAEERELMATRTKAEFREVFERQMRIRDEIDFGPVIPADVVIADLRAMVAGWGTRRRQLGGVEESPSTERPAR
jgi:hypothetical protein